MSIAPGLSTSASALTAQRLRMDVIAGNIANAQTTHAADGGPYKRQQVVFSPGAPLGRAPFQLAALRAGGDPLAAPGLSVAAIVADQTPGQRVFDPGHPDADANGYVTMPNVDITTEMIDLMTAQRAYEANITALNATKTAALRALDIGR